MIVCELGCEYHGYSSDVTRTWPVNGKFTSQQREIYELVYCVQEELIQMCGSLPTLDDLFESMCYLLGKRLQEVGLIGIQPSSEYLMKVLKTNVLNRYLFYRSPILGSVSAVPAPRVALFRNGYSRYADGE